MKLKNQSGNKANEKENSKFILMLNCRYNRISANLEETYCAGFISAFILVLLPFNMHVVCVHT